MNEYIKEKGGSYSDKKWQLEYFEEYQVIGLGNDSKRTANGIGAFSKKLGSDTIVSAMNGHSPSKTARRSTTKKEKDFTLKDIEKMKAENRLKIKEKESLVTKEDQAKEETG